MKPGIALQSPKCLSSLSQITEQNIHLGEIPSGKGGGERTNRWNCSQNACTLHYAPTTMTVQIQMAKARSTEVCNWVLGDICELYLYSVFSLCFSSCGFLLLAAWGGGGRCVALLKLFDLPGKTQDIWRHVWIAEPVCLLFWLPARKWATTFFSWLLSWALLELSSMDCRSPLSVLLLR